MLTAILGPLIGSAITAITKSPEAGQAAQEIAQAYPVTTVAVVAAGGICLPGLILEFILRKIPTEKRRGVLAGVRAVGEWIVQAADYADKKADSIPGLKPNLKVKE